MYFTLFRSMPAKELMWNIEDPMQNSCVFLKIHLAKSFMEPSDIAPKFALVPRMTTVVFVSK